LAYFSQIEILTLQQSTTYPQSKTKKPPEGGFFEYNLTRTKAHYPCNSGLLDGAGHFALMKRAQAAAAARSNFEVGRSEFTQCLRVFVINFFFVVSAIHASFRFRWFACFSVGIIFVHNY